MRIVLDTNVLFNRGAMLALADDPRPKILPAVAFAERARQRQRDFGEPPGELRHWLASVEIEIEPFGPEEAARVAAGVSDDRAWGGHARDAMIAGHVRKLDELWTFNAKDFRAVGLDERHIVDLAGADPREMIVDLG